MQWTKYRVFLAVLMVLTGSMNTLTTKWADQTSSVGTDKKERVFDHPYLQATAMFFGEMVCLLLFKILRRRGHQSTLTLGMDQFNPFILMPAALCDMVGTSVMYIGLTLTYASSFQMFRGSIIVFVALLSVAFLQRRISKKDWVAIGIIILGLLVVGASDFMYPSKSDSSKGRNSVITGDLLIVIAQIISACQMVYEEKYVTGLDIPPLQAVGWEGVFGFLTLSSLLVVFYWIPAPPYFGNNPRGTIEDVVDGMVQIGNNPYLLAAVTGMIVSIAFFNFAGISVTKEMSATSRMVLDSIRTIVIWLISLCLQWQEFHALQLLGFFFLIIGMCLYNDIFTILYYRYYETVDFVRVTNSVDTDLLYATQAQNV